MMCAVHDAAALSTGETSRFLVALGEAMIDAGDPVTHVQRSLLRVARSTMRWAPRSS
jgi:hypothetical protein